ncbi:Fe-S cluster assembly protein SufD [Pusillimonas sp. (ex Stolz et al. 2005)]|uniref:Fe-S cluster assembly protein SufD n=1 Tax=Pusillimonas sp. (ex Stolz et al. 2005) TaxID=1979962 RepID=UPI00262A1F3B|nr:Fe-S cluster assembly protein SufD [Pusillimonas sp. (ex Stolz et al. 2005)]
MSELLQFWHQRAQSANLPGSTHPWLIHTRQRALDRFMAEGWPTTRHPDWRHTSLAFLQQQVFDGQPVSSTQFEIDALRQGQGGHWMVFIDGRFHAGLSRIGPLNDNIRIVPLAQALTSGEAALESAFGNADEGGGPAALNLALAADGAYIDIPARTILDEPLHLVFISAGNATASFPRNIVLLGEGAEAVLVEHYIGHAEDATFTNAVLRGRLGSNSRLTHLKVQQEQPEAFHLAMIDIEQDSGSTYESHSISMGARLARHDIGTRFGGTKCHALLNGFFYANGRRHVDHHTRIDHAQPDSTSHEFYRGILDDSAQGVFTGRIQVREGADGTDAIQRSDNLLLSRTARVTTQPELEIYADDVKCAHGATVGQIDEESLFYLRSRGLSEAHAHGVMTYAFAAQALKRITLEPMRRRVATTVRNLLPGGALLGDIS